MLTLDEMAKIASLTYRLEGFQLNRAPHSILHLTTPNQLVHYGDVEYRGDGLNLNTGNRCGFVDATVGSGSDINKKTTLTWRP